MLAHELRRRMAALRVVGEAIAMLRGRGLDPASMVDLLLGEVDDLEALAGELLGDPPRAAPGDAATAVDLVAVVRSAARTVAIARGAAVRVQADVQVEVQGSPTMLRQAIENLIDNAAVHGGPDGVEVAVRADPAAGQVEVIVSDRGVAAGADGGHGIGLFVVRRFLDEAGGRSWVEERQGGGTVVGLSLPLRPAVVTGPDPLDTAVNS